MTTTDAAQVPQDLPQVDHMKVMTSTGHNTQFVWRAEAPSRLDDSLYSKELAPHYMQLAGKLASSDLIPKSFRGKPQDLFICWAMGYQVGLTPEQSQQCIAVINGKPAMWGDDMLALCMAHKDFIDIEEHSICNKDGSVIGYVCTVWRKDKKPKSNEFTLEMAKKAGLLAKGGVWTQYPDRMLKLRARGFTLRDAFPDALKGIKPREEVEDYIDADYSPVEHRGSRTELLKKDILNKQGVSNVEAIDAIYGSVAPMEDRAPAVPTEESPESMDEEDAQEKNPDFHAEIKRLIEEKQFTEERLAKALTYYEVDSIEELNSESAHHFIQQLLKL